MSRKKYREAYIIAQNFNLWGDINADGEKHESALPLPSGMAKDTLFRAICYDVRVVGFAGDSSRS